METREKSSYLKTDQLHTSLSNKETSSHRLRHRRKQQIPPTTTLSQKCLGHTIDSDSRPEQETPVSDPTTTLSQKCLGRTGDSDSRPEHETPVSDTQNIITRDTLSQTEDKEDVHRCTSTQRIRRFLLTIYFPYPATPYAFKESLHHLMSKEQRLYSLEPEETKILRSLIKSQRLLFRAYFSKILRYKISLL
ncbi:hypothetical protein F2Q69_00057584 [Brassica cretica]|uniref:Uncharacterized protein n=1 Tax=Brassica cretica TaxID=69181 RepID=A0A8S9MXZ9_BRACR|nr:hypothetical protein F2Q69_00057584 [Brassica cretica]